MSADGARSGTSRATARSTTLVVWRNRALGDAILAIPALRALRALVPHRWLAIVGYPDAWRVIDPCCYDDAAAIEAPDFAGLFAGTVTDTLREWLADRCVGAAVAWTTRPFGRTLEACGVPRVAQALPFPPPSIHAADWLVATVRRLADDADEAGAAPVAPAVPALAFTPHERALAARRLRAMLRAEAPEQVGSGGLGSKEPEHGRVGLKPAPMDSGTLVRPSRAPALECREDVPRPVIIHPGSGEAWKRWPAERYAQFADALLDRGVPVMLSAGPSDAATLAAVRRQMRATVEVPVLAGLSARELAACFALARCYVGNDSGATHLAAAAGAPVVALFGPTDPQSWAPRGDVCLLRACDARATFQGQIRVCDDPACLAALSLDAVLAAVTARLGIRA